MSEAAHSHEAISPPRHQAEATTPNGPKGPFFSTPESPLSPDIAVLQHEVSEKPTGKHYLLTVLEELGLCPSKETAANIDEKEVTPLFPTSGSSWAQRSWVLEQVDQAYDSYGQMWSDFQGRKGLDLDALDELYDATDVYEDSSLLATFDKLRADLKDFPQFQEAERLARIIIRHEHEVT